MDALFLDGGMPDGPGDNFRAAANFSEDKFDEIGNASMRSR